MGWLEIGLFVLGIDTSTCVRCLSCRRRTCGAGKLDRPPPVVLAVYPPNDAKTRLRVTCLLPVISEVEIFTIFSFDFYVLNGNNTSTIDFSNRIISFLPF